MKVKLSPAQIDINAQIEALRLVKQNKKNEIASLEQDIMNVDIQIRDLRQSFAQYAIVEEKPKRVKKHVETQEEKLARLTAECDALRKELGFQ